MFVKIVVLTHGREREGTKSVKVRIKEAGSKSLMGVFLVIQMMEYGCKPGRPRRALAVSTKGLLIWQGAQQSHTLAQS